jgi:anti-sigma factor RsiW
MPCQELVEVITAYLEGTLPEPDRTRFEEHLVVCPHCRIYLEQMRDTITALRGLDGEQIPEGDKQELLSLFRNWRGNET